MGGKGRRLELLAVASGLLTGVSKFIDIPSMIHASSSCLYYYEPLRPYALRLALMGLPGILVERPLE